MTTIEQLKAWFKRDLKPKQAHFYALLESFWHKSEKIPAENIEGLTVGAGSGSNVFLRIRVKDGYVEARVDVPTDDVENFQSKNAKIYLLRYKRTRKRYSGYNPKHAKKWQGVKTHFAVTNGFGGKAKHERQLTTTNNGFFDFAISANSYVNRWQRLMHPLSESVMTTTSLASVFMYIYRQSVGVCIELTTSRIISATEHDYVIVSGNAKGSFSPFDESERKKMEWRGGFRLAYSEDTSKAHLLHDTMKIFHDVYFTSKLTVEQNELRAHLRIT